MNKPVNPDGNRGSYFPAPAYQKKYRPPDEVQTAADHIKYLKHLMQQPIQSDDETPDAPAPMVTCETSQDHDWIECERYGQTIVCEKCGQLAEHPARWYSIKGYATHASQNQTDD